MTEKKYFHEKSQEDIKAYTIEFKKGMTKMTDTIVIRRTRNADSRTADENMNRDTLLDDTTEHIRNVKDGMNYLSLLLRVAGSNHDFTKMKYFDEFARNVLAGHTDEEFINADWYQKHIFEERHHLNANCPPDVNLIDVLEMIVDCVMAGKGRSGHITPSYLILQDPSILERAYWNTIRLLDENVYVDEDGEILDQ